MRLHQWIVLALGLACAGALMAFVHEDSGKIEATIFTYDGHDFVRAKTTLLTSEGKSAVNSKLEHDTPAYKALIQKHSYIGEATVFGKKYDADYAPLTSDDGKL